MNAAVADLFTEDAPAIAPALRPYQVSAIEQLDAAIAAGRRSVVLVSPTGSGKTVLASALIQRERDCGKKALFLAPRRELVAQASRQLTRFGITHGVLLAGSPSGRNLYSSVQVASIDTLLSRLVRRQSLTLPDFNLVIVDEAHLSITETRKDLLDLWPKAVRIGLTATPTRKDGRALGTLYDTLIEPVTTADLQRDGYLCRARYFSVSEPDLEKVHTVAGDYHQGELENVINQPKLIGDVVEHWHKHAGDRRTVIFATSIKHSVALCEEFLRAGVAAEHVDADTPQELRDATFNRFRSGRTQVLTNCFLASYGFDLPELSCVVLARPTKSLMLYLQMIGRGLRTAEGKSDCLVLDHSGAVHRHGFAHDRRTWTLEGRTALVAPERTPREAREAKVLNCPECQAVFCGARLCPECGYFFAPVGKEIRTIDGELVEIGAHMEPEQIDRMIFYGELIAISAEHSFKTGWASHKYRDRYGTWPMRAWEGPLPMPSEATRRWVHSRYIAWKKAQNAAAVYA